MRNWRFVMEVDSKKWLCLFIFFHFVKVLLSAGNTQAQDITNLHSSFLKNLFFISEEFLQ